MAKKKRKNLKFDKLKKKHKEADNKFIRRFAWNYFLCMAAFFCLIKIKFIQDIIDINGLYTEYIVVLASKIIGFTGLPCAYQGSLLKLPTITLNVKFGCNGLEVAMIFLIALLVYPASWKKKFIGISLGLIFLQFINLIRIAGLAYAGEYYKSMFNLLHFYVGQGIMFVFVLFAILFYLNFEEGFSKNLQKNKIVISLSIFAVSFVLFLALWLQVKDSYNKGLAYMASHITAFVKDVRFESIEGEKESLTVFFYIHKPGNKGKAQMGMEGVGVYTRSTPLIFGIFGGLFFFIKRRKRAYLEGVLILVLIHLLYFATSEIMGLSTIMAKEGIENTTGFWMWFWNFLVDFAIWLVPFFVGGVTFFRFSEFSLSNQPGQLNQLSRKQ